MLIVLKQVLKGQINYTFESLCLFISLGSAQLLESTQSHVLQDLNFQWMTFTFTWLFALEGYFTLAEVGHLITSPVL